MPIFEFRCLECSHIFEKLFLNDKDSVDLECPECHSPSLERVVSRANFVMGPGAGSAKPKITEKSCSPGNSCMSIDIPGPTR